MTRRLLLGLVFIVAFLSPGHLLADGLRPRTILFLDQSEMRGPFYYDIFSAFRSRLDEQAGPPVTLYAEKLDLSRFGGEAYEQALLQNLRAKYSDKSIGVIVAIGSATLEMVLRWRSTVWPGTPIVFAMVDETTAVRLNPPADVTGHIAKLRLADEIGVARALVSDLKRVALVGDAWESQTAYRHWKDEIPTATTGLEVIDLTGLTMRELQKRVAQLPDRTAIVYSAIYSDGEGNYFPPADAVALVAKTASRPIIVAAETFVGRGALGGYVMIPSAMGRQAAESALGILDGQNVPKPSAAVGNVVRMVFDWRQMQRWGISEARLPAGAEVQFRDPTVWEKYGPLILAITAALLFQTALICWLLYEHRRRNLAEVQSRQSLAELTYVNRIASAGLLSASVAHEVNQPLTGIVTRADAATRWLAAEVPNIARAKDALKEISEAGHRAAAIIKNIRSMFGKGTQEKSIVDINKLIRSVLALLNVDLRRHNIETRTNLADQLPLVFGNEVQLQQVIMNLMMNAIEAMNSAELRVLSVITELAKDNTVRVSIQDTGTGIDPTTRERLFTPLFTTKVRGMGMGLSICHSIIEEHDGRIWASPAALRGSIFRFEVPSMSRRDLGETSVALDRHQQDSKRTA